MLISIISKNNQKMCTKADKLRIQWSIQPGNCVANLTIMDDLKLMLLNDYLNRMNSKPAIYDGSDSSIRAIIFR